MRFNSGGLVESKFAEVPAVEEDEKEQRKLSGHSSLYYAEIEIDPRDTLLGQRWLCRKGGALFVAPSGHGKSVLAIQAANAWACGRTVFGIKPNGPLRSLIVQAEDDDGDLKEMGQSSYHIGLSEREQEYVRENTLIEPLNDLSGSAFLDAVDGFLEQWSTDLLWINPLTAYLGADDKDTKASTLFLRNGLNPILRKHNCAAIIIHHTPKTKFARTDDYKPSDWMYRGAGAATITNWARAIMVIDPCEVQGIYKFIGERLAKPTYHRQSFFAQLGG
jgi:RecA-family ATPase